MEDHKLTSRRRTRHANRTPQLQILTEAQLNGMLPLDYMLAVIRDPNATQLRRDKMAIAAAPYCHARKTDDLPKGKKDQREEAAAMAGIGTPWTTDLEFEDRAQ
jgi:hypothetical protein